MLALNPGGLHWQNQGSESKTILCSVTEAEKDMFQYRETVI
jgi:hypothetical protein